MLFKKTLLVTAVTAVMSGAALADPPFAGGDASAVANPSATATGTGIAGANAGAVNIAPQTNTQTNVNHNDSTAVSNSGANSNSVGVGVNSAPINSTFTTGSYSNSQGGSAVNSNTLSNKQGQKQGQKQDQTQQQDAHNTQGQGQSQSATSGVRQQDMSTQSGAALDFTQINNAPSKTKATVQTTPFPPGVLQEGNVNPELYTPPTDSGPVKSLPLLVKYIEKCKPAFGQGVPSVLERVQGASGLTKVTFWASPQSYSYRQLTSNGDNWCDPNDGNQRGCIADQLNSGAIAPVKALQVIPQFPSQANGTCLGVMTVDSLEANGSLIDLVSDAVNYALTNITGYPTVYLVSVKDAVGYSLSVNSKGWGVGASPGVAAAANPATLFSGVLGFGMNGGSTQYGLQPGTTYLVIGCDTNSTKVHIDLADLAPKLGQGELPSQHNVNAQYLTPVPVTPVPKK